MRNWVKETDYSDDGKTVKPKREQWLNLETMRQEPTTPLQQSPLQAQKTEFPHAAQNQTGATQKSLGPQTEGLSPGKWNHKRAAAAGGKSAKSKRTGGQSLGTPVSYQYPTSAFQGLNREPGKCVCGGLADGGRARLMASDATLLDVTLCLNHISGGLYPANWHRRGTNRGPFCKMWDFLKTWLQLKDLHTVLGKLLVHCIGVYLLTDTSEGAPPSLASSIFSFILNKFLSCAFGSLRRGLYLLQWNIWCLSRTGVLIIRLKALMTFKSSFC